MNVFMILLSTFSLALAWRNNAHVRTCQEGLIQPWNNSWSCHDVGDPVVLPVTDFSLIFNAYFFFWNKLSPISITPGSVQRKGHKASVLPE